MPTPIQGLRFQMWAKCNKCMALVDLPGTAHFDPKTGEACHEWFVTYLPVLAKNEEIRLQATNPQTIEPCGKVVAELPG